MELGDYLRILRRKGWIILLVAALTALAAFGFSKMQTNVYKSTLNLLVRPSRRVFEAADAAFLPVCLGGALCWDNALPPAVFDALPVDFVVSVLEALLAAGLLVTLRFLAMAISPVSKSCAEGS